MIQKCYFDKVRDIQEHVPSLATDLNKAIETNTVQDTGVVADFNSIEVPSAITGRVSDAFEAIDAQRAILASAALSAGASLAAGAALSSAAALAAGASLLGASLLLPPQPAIIVANIAALKTVAKTFFFIFFLLNVGSFFVSYHRY